MGDRDRSESEDPLTEKSRRRQEGNDLETDHRRTQRRGESPEDRGILRESPSRQSPRRRRPRDDYYTTDEEFGIQEVSRGRRPIPEPLDTQRTADEYSLDYNYDAQDGERAFEGARKRPVTSPMSPFSPGGDKYPLQQPAHVQINMGYTARELPSNDEDVDLKKGLMQMLLHQKHKSLWTSIRQAFHILLTRGASNGDDENINYNEVPSAVKQKQAQSNMESVWGCTWQGNLDKLREVKNKQKHSYFQKTGKHIFEQTGPEGETLLHVALLMNTEKHDDIANYLLQKRPHLSLHKPFVQISFLIFLAVNCVYEGPNYTGEHACHILVVHNKLAMLKDFIKKGADVHIPRATGTFFKRNGTLYFGETILAFAAVMGHFDIVKYLVNDVGVDPNMADHYGNNVLHVLAHWGYFNDTRGRYPEKEEYKNFGRHGNVGGIYKFLHDGGADDKLVNHQGMTPLQVAVAKGHTEMVQAIINERREIMWIYGKASSYLYDLSEIDTYVDPNTMNHTKGALEIAIEKKNRDILNLPLFQRLLEAKWVSYAGRMYYFSFASSFIYMLFFTVMVLLLPNGAEFFDYSGTDDSLPARDRFSYFSTGGIGYTRLIIECFVLLCNAVTFFEEIDELVTMKSSYFFGNGSLENSIQWINMASFFSAVIMRVLGLFDAENALLGMHALTGWIYLLTYTKGFRQIGTLVLILGHIVTGDLMRFVLLACVFILAFGEAIFLQMEPYAYYYVHQAALQNVTNTNSGVEDWRGLPTGFVWVFRFLMQQGVYDDYRNARNSGLAIVLFMTVFFLLLILLLNVLIAQLNQTFSSIIGDTEKQWRMIWAELIMFMDEKIRVDHAQSGEKSKVPVSRIGFPKKAVNYLNDNRRQNHVERRAQAVRLKWYQQLFTGHKHNKKVAENDTSYYIYCLIFEFRDDLDLPTRMIASANANSKLSGKYHDHNFSSTPWDKALLQKMETEDEPVAMPKIQSRRGKSEARPRSRSVSLVPFKRGD